MSEFRGNEYLEYLRAGYGPDQVAKMFQTTRAVVVAQSYWWRMRVRPI
jgi:hypothetical protein